MMKLFEATPTLNKKESEAFEEKMVKEEKKKCSGIDKKILDELTLKNKKWKEHYEKTGELLCPACSVPMKPYKGEEYSWFCPDCSPHMVLNLLREMQKTVEKDVKKIVEKQKEVLDELK